jgi:hypothetical protein
MNRAKRQLRAWLKQEAACSAYLWPALEDLFGDNGRLQRLLVHVLADRQCLSQQAAPSQQGGFSGDRGTRPAAGLLAFDGDAAVG